LVPTFYAGRLIGALLLWRSPTQPDWNPQEIALISALAGQLAVAIDQYSDYHRLLNASRTDALTGLFNRRAFDEELERRWHRLSRDRAPAVLFYLDLDNFKIVNDRRGHETGDEALRHVADILRRNTRGNDLVARLGGDEFAVWVEEISEADAVRRAKVFLAAAVSLNHYSGSKRKPLQMSIGIATYDPESKESIAALIKRADSAMYEIKMMGKGNYALAPAARQDK
jgi:diguanylate cyclase (GGDEF)-like protein